MKKILPSILILISFHTFSQDTSINKQIDIYRKWPGWKMDGRWLKGNELKQELYKVPDAIPLYQKSKKNLIIAASCLVSSATFAFLSRQESDIGSPNFGKNKTGFAIAGIIAGGAGINFFIRSKKQLKKAIRIRNEKYPLIY